MNLDESIKEQIEKHLPNLVAGKMKEFINQAEINEKHLNEIKGMCDNLIKTNLELKQENDILKKLESSLFEKEKVLNNKEKELNKKELELSKTILEAKVASMEERLKDSKEFMLMLAKNPRAIEYMNSSYSESVPVRDQFGNHATMQQYGGTNGTKEAVETKD